MTDKQGITPPWVRVLGTRLLEAVVAGGVFLYGNNLIMGKDIEHIKENQTELKKQIDKIMEDFYTPRVNKERMRIPVSHKLR